ncbi:hypothetical protein THRCLA_09696 [Thraustotheca clavata]|uniref:Folate-Biopterin Transporter (FBT) family n=1 Tax=Thraustotheca clavata TaxID=74557 RepID=A0A1V9YUZ3_9STRA|nr:hypothetical protein THRCLA_09696 [Thraustotheca clavata]
MYEPKVETPLAKASFPSYQARPNSVGLSIDAPETPLRSPSTRSLLFRLCLYGFFVELKPSEAYLNQYLTQDKGFSNTATNEDIYPWYTYGKLLMLLVLPLIVERFQYRTVLLIESIGFLCTRVLLIFGQSLFLMQLMQVTYALGTASKIVYLTIIYREVPRDEYHHATAVIWTAQLAGKCLAGVLGQVLVSYDVSLLALNYVSCGTVAFSLALAISIPKDKADVVAIAVPEKRNFRPLPSRRDTGDSIEVSSTGSVRVRAHLHRREPTAPAPNVWHWTNILGLTWTILYCCESLVGNYIQNRWTDFSASTLENGIMTAVYTISGAIATLVMSRMLKKVLRSARFLRSILLIGSIGFVIVSYRQAVAINLWRSYLWYILYGAIFYALITTVSAELALQCSTNEYAKMFAIVMLCAAILETMVTFLLQGTTDNVTPWFGAVAILHGFLLFFHLFVSCRVPLEPLRESALPI